MDILKQRIDSLRNDLDRINREWQDLDGTNLSACQCYHLETDPPHFLYNLNCPNNLKEELKGLIDKYFPANESGVSE